MAPRSCPDDCRWRDFLDGALSPGAAADLSDHLDHCEGCRRTLEGLTGGSGAWLGTACPDRKGRSPALRRVMEQLKGEGDAVPAGEPALDFLDPPGRPGQLGKLGPYEVLAVIGRGGMGVVLKAFDPALHRFVAIKVLAPHWAGSGAGRRRLAREGRATAAVRHDHVVAVHAVEEVRGLPYLVMEYVHGASLQQRLDRSGPLGLQEVLRIGMQTAAGLEAAHAQGLIHRDVKPSNILLENGVERVKLSDFGLARAVDDASLTQSGVIAGTPLYMSPEQARGESLDARSDLFSLGSVLYTACTGRPPFRAPTTVAVLKRVCEDEARPIREINPDIPEWLEGIIATLHAKRPGDRFQSAGEVSRLLAGHLAHLQHPGRVPPPESPTPPPPPPVEGNRRLAWSLALTGVVLLVLLVGGPCLAVWMLGGMAANIIPPLPEGPGPAFQRQGPRAELAHGKVERGKDGKLHFRVDYELRPGDVDLTLSFVWVVRCGERTLHEQMLKAEEMGVEGTLQADRPVPKIGADGPLETYLESRCLIPGKLGWQRERISNVVPLAP